MSKRSIALLGSGEFEDWSAEVDLWMLSRTRPGRVLILPTASAPEGDEVFDRWARMGRHHFQSLGVPAEVLPLKDRADADRREFVKLLDDSAYVYFSGGNPAYLADALRDSAFWDGIVAGMDEGLGYVGCSAGISCLGEFAPDAGGGPERPTLETFTGRLRHAGLGLFPRTVLGPHWDMLNTYVPGLSEMIASTVAPDGRLLAVDERTAVIGDGAGWQVVGMSGAGLLEKGEWRSFRVGDHFRAALLD